MSEWSISQRGIFDELVKQAQSAFESLKALIMDQIVKPITDIGNLKDKLNEVIQNIIGQVKEKYNEEINKIIGDVQNMIECYKKEAEKLGINIKDCYQKSQDEIIALPQGFLTNITKCGTDEYDNGMILIKSATDLFDGVMADFNAIPDKINACTKEGWWTATTCITGKGIGHN